MENGLKGGKPWPYIKDYKLQNAKASGMRHIIIIGESSFIISFLLKFFTPHSFDLIILNQGEFLKEL